MLHGHAIIEFARQADAAEIAGLSQRYIEYNLGWEYTPEKIAQLIRHPAKNVVVAREHRQLIGFGIMTYREEVANLDLLAVRQQNRKQGIGRQIVTWLEKVALTAGLLSVQVQVREINTSAIRFYQQLGYAVIGHQAGYYRGRETAIFMSHKLRVRPTTF